MKIFRSQQKAIFTTAVFLFCSLASIAQIRGILSDSTRPVPDATVALLQGNNATATVFTDKNGAFVIPDVSPGNYRVYITLMGYQPLFKNITVAATSLNLDTIYLKGSGLTLKGVEIKQEAPPVAVKKDTLEFNAKSIKTRANAPVEDLLKKVPGVSVDKEGKVTTQGETVKRILVDGKPFFGDNAAMTMKNLPANLIDKIQVIDSKVLDDDDNTEKIINITIKKDRRKSLIGKGSLGIGTARHFAGNANVNSFNDNSRLSVIGNGNNLNDRNYSPANTNGNYNINGLTRSWLGAVNYNENFGTKLKVDGSYTANNSRTKTNTSSVKQSFFPDTTFYYNQNSTGLTDETSHNVDMHIEYNIDSSQLLVIMPTANFSNNRNFQNNSYQSLDEHKQASITGVSANTITGSTSQAGAHGMYRKTFAKPGRIFNAGFQLGFNAGNNQNFYKTTDTHTDYVSGYDRLTNAVNSANNANLRLSYTEPLPRDRSLELSYDINTNYSLLKNLTYDVNAASGKYDHLNDSLSNVSSNTFTSQQAGIRVRTRRCGYDYTLGMNVQFTDMKSTITRHNVNFFPTAQLNYHIDKGKQLFFGYNGNTMQPTIQQLQPLPNLASSLYVQEGNPDLKPSFSHNVMVGYNAFDRRTFRGFFANLHAQYVSNKIVNMNRLDTSGKQFSKPVNTGGAYNINANVANSFPFHNLTLHLNTALNYSRDPSFNVAQKVFTKNIGVIQEARCTYNYKDIFDVATSASVNYIGTQYAAFSTNYFTYTFSFDNNVNLPAGFIVGSDVGYVLNTGRAAGYNTSATILNAFVSKSVFKQQQGLIKIYGYDLLKSNISINRNAGENFIEDTHNMILQPYFMLSFTYFLKNVPVRIDKG